MTVCPNHHRQFHFGEVEVAIRSGSFDLVIDEQALTIPKLKLAAGVSMSETSSRPSPKRRTLLAQLSDAAPNCFLLC
jgi:hypothetical protein